MTILTKIYIDEHCASLNISRSALTEFTIPDDFTEIGTSAFSQCFALVSINIPNSVTMIGEDAFDDCTSLTSIFIPESVNTIQICAFVDCTALTSINIPNGITRIDRRSWQRCSSLTTVTLPDSVTEIDFEAFDECTALTSINFPDGMTTIFESAFIDCTALTSIIIPDSITTIGEGAFWNCSSLTQIICNNPNLFTNQNINNRERVQFISISDYLKDNYQTLLNAINNPRNSSEFNTNHVSSKELNLIMKLQRANYFPNWETIANTFEDRSIYQIRSILSFYNKTECFPHENKVTRLLPLQLRDTTMFLNPIENEMLMGTTTFLYRTT